MPFLPERRPVHPLETALVWVVAMNLCLLPWALGDMHAWSQILGLGVSAGALILSQWPRAWNDESSESLPPFARLIRFPVFWAGLVLLGYVAVQGLNPAWHYATDGRSWWIEPRAHLAWLPSGIDAPFSISNPWRALVVYGTVWCLVCATWSGFLRRHSWRILSGILVGNAALVALLGFLEKLAGAERIFWTFAAHGGYFVASFIYRNHAGAYFNLLTALAAGVAWWHLRRAKRRLEGPGAGVVFGFLAFWLGAIVIYSFSRTSIFLLLSFTLLVGVGFAVHLATGRRQGLRRAEATLLILALVGIASIPVVTLETEGIWERFAAFAADPGASLADRAMARKAAGEMRRERPLLGWGAGCFRYGFPNYTRWHPEIDHTAGSRVRAYWEHAHDDWLEFPVELGELGMLPIGFVFGWGTIQLVRRRFWNHPVSFCSVLGCLLLLTHAGFDFVFQNPAILITSCVLFFGAIRWAELEGTVPTKRIKSANRSGFQN